MSKLPSLEDLGGTSRVSGERPIADISQAGQAMAKGTEALGTGIAKAGSDLGQYAFDQARYRNAVASSDFTAKDFSLRAELSQDKDYPTLVDRYVQGANDHRDEIAKTVPPAFRDRFVARADAAIAHGRLWATNHAKGLERTADIGYLDEMGPKLQEQALGSDDPVAQSRIMDTFREQVDASVGKGVITPSEGLARKQQFALQYTHAKVLGAINSGQPELIEPVLKDLRAPGEKSPFRFLRPDQRENLISSGQSALQKLTTNDNVAFDQRYSDTRAQAYDTGDPGRALSEPEFVRRFGPEAGTLRYGEYKKDLDLAARIPQISGLDNVETSRFLDQLRPKPDQPGYAAALSRFQEVQSKLIDTRDQEKVKDPAAFAVRRLPAAGDAYQAFGRTAADPAVSDAERGAAAQKFAATTLMEQGRVDVPAEMRRILPKDYVEHFSKAITGAADSDDPGKRVGVIAQVQREATMWGEHWPAVMQQLAPGVQPIVRAIAAGADTTAMTRLLSLPKEEAKRPSTILAQQNDTKWKDFTSSLNDAMAPLRRTLVGRQLDRDYPGYYEIAKELGALYVRDGKSATDAAGDAFKALIGDRYEFRDTWRLPKSAGVKADDVQQGVFAAKRMIGQSGAGAADAFGIKPANNDIGLTDPRGDSLSKFARDGIWVTRPDNGGLNLTYGDKFVRGNDGKPFTLSWEQLGALGRSQPRPGYLEGVGDAMTR